MYFSFDQLTVDGVGRWLEAAREFRTELGRVMATRYNPGYLEDRIMNVCAALESFDKRLRQVNEDHYLARIKECIHLAGAPFLELIAEDPNEWARKVKELRHDLAHHREQFRQEGSVGGHVIAEQLYWLFVLCMLRVAQVPPAVLSSITNHNQWRWLVKQAEKGVAG